MSEGEQHVLIIDDEAQIRQFVRAGMELGGYRVSEAANGADALREITLHPIDLVILDLALPDIDGSELLERIRAWSSVPVIILSVRAGEAEKVKLLELGADDYVAHQLRYLPAVRMSVVMRQDGGRQDRLLPPWPLLVSAELDPAEQIRLAENTDDLTGRIDDR